MFGQRPRSLSAHADPNFLEFCSSVLMFSILNLKYIHLILIELQEEVEKLKRLVFWLFAKSIPLKLFNLLMKACQHLAHLLQSQLLITFTKSTKPLPIEDSCCCCIRTISLWLPIVTLVAKIFYFFSNLIAVEKRVYYLINTTIISYK